VDIEKFMGIKKDIEGLVGMSGNLGTKFEGIK